MDVEPAALCSHLQADEKVAARKAAVAPGSQFHARLAKLDAVLAGHAKPEGDLDMVHVKVFCEARAMVSGFYDGFPTDDTLFAPYANIQAVCARVADSEKVKAYYQGRGGLYNAFSR